jgi:tRNA G18 (ribose-2'-O)-methylase SpoU
VTWPPVGVRPAQHRARPGGRLPLPPFVAGLTAAVLVLVGAAPPAPEPAAVRVREVDGQNVTLEVTPPPSFSGTALPASAFRVLEGDQPRNATVRRYAQSDLRVVLVVDPLLDEDALATVRASLVTFVRALPEGTPVGVVVAKERPDVIPPSRDGQTVVDALQDITHRRTGSMYTALRTALDGASGGAGRGVVVAINSGHFERPSAVSQALERRLLATPVATHLVDVRQAALGVPDVPPPPWMNLMAQYEAVERPADVRLALGETARMLRDTYEVVVRARAADAAGLTVRISAAGREAEATTIADLPDPPKPPLPRHERPGWVVPLLIGMSVGLLSVGVLLYLPRRRRRTRLSAEVLGANGHVRSGLRALSREAFATRKPPDAAAAAVHAPAGVGLAASGSAPPGLPTDPTSETTARSTGGGDDTDRGPHVVARTPARPTSLVGGEQVEGLAAVTALLRGPRAVRQVLVGPTSGDDVNALLTLALRRRVRVVRSSDAALREIAASPEPGGVVAWAAPIRHARLVDLCRSPVGRRPLVLALPAQVPEEELGVLLREGEREGVTGVVVPQSAEPVVTAHVTNLAGGAIERLGIAVVREISPAAARLRAAGALLLGVDSAGPPMHVLGEVLDQESGDRPVVMLLGGRAGLGRQLVRRCHAVASAGIEPGSYGSPLLEQWARCAALLGGAPRRGIVG